VDSVHNSQRYSQLLSWIQLISEDFNVRVQLEFLSWCSTADRLLKSCTRITLLFFGTLAIPVSSVSLTALPIPNATNFVWAPRVPVDVMLFNWSASTYIYDVVQKTRSSTTLCYAFRYCLVKWLSRSSVSSSLYSNSRMDSDKHTYRVDQKPDCFWELITLQRLVVECNMSKVCKFYLETCMPVRLNIPWQFAQISTTWNYA